MAAAQRKRIAANRQDLTGQCFGKRTAIKIAGKTKWGENLWECICECGTSSIVRTSQLRSGKSNSCGCGPNTTNRTHGMTNSSEYTIWHGMLQRCYNPKASRYERYGGRGIKVCDEWKNSFETFVNDMGLRPSKKHSLDRIDNDGNYEPSNVRWELAAVQMNKTRRSNYLCHNGCRKTIAEWSRLVGINAATIHNRLSYGWPVAKALTTPIDARCHSRTKP